MARGIWNILGIKSTTDRKTIRSAYAARLKNIDAAAAPNEFAQLRDAYEQALLIARSSSTPAGDISIGVSEIGRAGDAPEGDPHAPQHDPAQEVADSRQQGERAFSAIVSILTDDRRPGVPLDDDEQPELVVLIQQLLNWLNQAGVDEARDAEFGIAHLLASTIPRSDAILEMAAEYFDWTKTAGNWDKPQTVRDIVARINTNRYYAELMEETHPLHNALRALTASGAEPFWRRPRKKEVRELLKAAYGRHTSLLHVFNPERLGEWERRIDLKLGNSGGAKSIASAVRWYWWPLAIIVINLLRLCGSVPDQQNPAGPSPSPEISRPVGEAPVDLPQVEGALSHRYADIARALERVFGSELTAAELNEPNSEIFKLLEAEWSTARDRGHNADEFARDIATLLTDQFESAVRKSGMATLRRYWAVRKKMMQILLSTHADDCRVVFIAGQYKAFPPDLTQEYQRLMASVLPTAKAQPRSHALSERFVIPGEIVVKARQESGLTADQFSSAIKGGELPRTQCTATLALINILLADETQTAASLLRKM